MKAYAPLAALLLLAFATCGCDQNGVRRHNGQLVRSFLAACMEKQPLATCLENCKALYPDLWCGLHKAKTK